MKHAEPARGLAGQLDGPGGCAPGRLALLAGAVWLFLAPACQADGNFVYVDPDYHFQMTLPAGWKTIPRPVLDAAAGNPNLPGGGPKYHAGLQLSDRDDFNYPCILIQATPANPTDLASVRQMLAEANRKANLSVTARAKEQGKGFRLSDPVLHEERQSIWFLSDTNVDQKGVAGIRGMIVLFAGR